MSALDSSYCVVIAFRTEMYSVISPVVTFLMKPIGLPICLSEIALPNDDAKNAGGGSNGKGENDSYLNSHIDSICVYQVSSFRFRLCRTAAKS